MVQYMEGPLLLLAKVPDRIGRIGIFLLLFQCFNDIFFNDICFNL